MKNLLLISLTAFLVCSVSYADESSGVSGGGGATSSGTGLQKGDGAGGLSEVTSSSANGANITLGGALSGVTTLSAGNGQFGATSVLSAPAGTYSLQIGTGSAANAGWVFGTNASGVAGMWPTFVAPSTSNYSILADNSAGALNLSATSYVTIGHGATKDILIANNMIRNRSTGVYAFSDGAFDGTNDTAMSRCAAGVFCFGTGAQGSTAGQIQATRYSFGSYYWATSDGSNLILENGGGVRAIIGDSLMRLGNAGAIGFASTAVANNAFDTAISRCSAGVLCVGTGAQGSYAGEVRASTFSMYPSWTKITGASAYMLFSSYNDVSFSLNGQIDRASLPANYSVGFSSANDDASSGSFDTAWSRCSAGVHCFGTGAQGAGDGTVISASAGAKDKTGADQAGNDFTVSAGNGTGTGGSGKVSIKVSFPAASSSTANTMLERVRVDNNGFHIYDSSSVERFAFSPESSSQRLQVYGGMIMYGGGTDGIYMGSGNTEFKTTTHNSSAQFSFKAPYNRSSPQILTNTNGVTINDVLTLTPKATAPATCSIGDIYVDTSGAYCGCSATNTWEIFNATGSCA